MSDSTQPAKSNPGRLFVYGLVFVVVAAATVLVTALLVNIMQRQREAEQFYVEIVKLDEDTIDPEKWGKNFPFHYNDYIRTVDTERTRHGGSDAINKLEQYPFLTRMFAGHLFSVDFRAARGHAYMLKDQDQTERVKQGEQPGACLHCHSSVMKAYRDAGQDAGFEGKEKQEMEGFKIISAMDWKEARPLVEHAISCVDCHDPRTMHLRVTRPAFLNGIKELAKSDYPLPHLPSIERWRKEGGEVEYEVNKLANHQEMRTFVCAQCHVEYYFQKETNLLVYPWAKGLKVEQMEEYYDEKGFNDWIHAESGAGMLKAQHPEFEMWNQGIHARSGVSCADCHMPYKRVGAVKISDHHVRSPLLNVNRACQVCHSFSESELLARAEAIQDSTKAMMSRAKKALEDLLDAVKEAKTNGVNKEVLAKAQKLHRKAQWRLDYVFSENSLGFHAPQETARILAEAIDYARQGELAIFQGVGGKKKKK